MILDGNPPRRPSSEPAPVVLSAGGTGGHMFPAFALAHELRARGIPVVFVTDRRGLKYEAQYPDIPFRVIRAETLRPGLLPKLRLIAELAVGTAQSLWLLRRLRPRAVVGFGGYPSFPLMLAAQLAGAPTVLHEQNAVLGRANRLLAARATRIALALPDMAGMPEKLRARTTVTGNPVRAEIAAVGARPYVPPQPGRSFRLLILGGSLGASVFSNLLPRAIGLLDEVARKRLSIVQQCRAVDIAAVRHAYDVMGIGARLETFVNDVPDQLETCHLLIARSGASTVTEAAVAGRPAIFVPYPYHKDQQQKKNAAVLARAGAAILFEEKDLSAEILAKELENLMDSPVLLSRMAEAAGKALAVDAAVKLADMVVTL